MLMAGVRVVWIACAFLLFRVLAYGSEEDPGISLEVGVSIHQESGEILDRVEEMRIGWVRVDVGWADIEPTFETPPLYVWDAADAVVTAEKIRGRKILWLVGGTPSWASTNGKRNGVPKDAVARERFREFVRAMVERYVDDVHYFEVWNEPNLERFWTGSVEEYVNCLLIPAYEEVKRVDPEKKVVAPGLALLHSSARIKVDDFFRVLGWYEAYRYVDIVSQHIYEDRPRDIIEQFEDGNYECLWFVCWKNRDGLHSIYRRAGFGNYSIWITEFGWKSNETGEERQGKYLVETLDLLARRRVFGAAFIYELYDDPRYTKNYGLLKNDGSPKTAYYALKDRTLSLVGPPAEEDKNCDPWIDSERCAILPRHAKTE